MACGAGAQPVAVTLSFAGLLGALPPELAYAPSLLRLDLQSCRFSGPLPPSWSSLTALQVLNLGNNQLSGTLPAEWSVLAALTALSLQNNSLVSTIPTGWGAGLLGLSGATSLRLSSNAQLCGGG